MGNSVNMDSTFLPLKETIDLHELGIYLDESHGFFMRRRSDGELVACSVSFIEYNQNIQQYDSPEDPIEAILWQQAFDWFRKKYNLIPYIDLNKRNSKFGYNIIRLDGPLLMEDLDTYEEARLACLVKLIELANKK